MIALLGLSQIGRSRPGLRNVCAMVALARRHEMVAKQSWLCQTMPASVVWMTVPDSSIVVFA